MKNVSGETLMLWLIPYFGQKAAHQFYYRSIGALFVEDNYALILGLFIKCLSEDKEETEEFLLLCVDD